MDSRATEVRRIFAASCELVGDARADYLRQQCGDDHTLRREVEELLQLDGEPCYLGEEQLAALRAQLDGGAAPAPERIGPFEVLAVLGRGGMGIVYRARQDRPAREVALKLLVPGLGDPTAHARFALEAEALGRLQHPGIAQIHAFGEAGTPQGPVPYLAMELVHGEPLDRWAQVARPSLADRVRVLIGIADAVHHAHQRGLIHRDLKPGNVFVDAAGRPKVLDFGIARLIDDDRTRTLRTHAGQLLGTLAYMSPEQAEGRSDEVDVRTDVYALGVVAYELLSGALPLDVTSDALATGLRRVIEEEPTPLGRRDRQLAGDLETVVATALRKDPEHRYASMQAFADDLRRYLAHEPILARPATAAYLTARFVRRHRAVVAGAAIALLALVLGTVFSVRWALRAEASARRAALAESRANEEARLANRVTGFVEGLFAAAAPGVALGRTITAKELVDRGAADMRDALADEPLLRARLSRFLGAVLSEMGDRATALPLIDDALRTLEATRPADDPTVIQVLVDQARALFVGRDSPAARTLFAEALARIEAAGLPHDNAWIRCHEGLGACALETHDLDAALEHYTLVRDARTTVASAAVRANDLVHLANVHGMRGDAAAAERLFTAAHELLAQADDPLLTANVATNLGVLRMAQDRPEAAEPLFREALAAGERLLGPDHPLLLRRLCNVAGVLSTLGRTAEAEPLLERALAIADRQDTPADDGVANVAMNLGNVRLDLRRPADALALYRRAAAIYERLGGPASPDLADALENEAMALERLGDATEAAALRRRVAAIRAR
ncbi:MAG: serine/threonine protein kinase [Planctomycetes bacterium]|nr:serine/threonine protein kinase [Planctomycetota bacterium]